MTSVGDKREGKKSETMMRMYNVKDYYKILDKVGRGTYGTVYKAKGVKDNKFYAIKKLENNDIKLQQQGFPITALREITLLKQIDHPNIIKLKEIIVSRPNKRNLYRGSTFLVFEYMDHDFAGLFKMKIKYSLPEIKTIVRQLLEGVNYLHKNKILHRDIKSANILLNDEGDVKLADFGLGRKVRFENLLTYKVVTLWYRAPELLLGYKAYTDKIDVWSLGCVVAEFFTGEVLFRKQTQFAQMERIYEVVGDFQANGMIINDESIKIYQNLQDLRPRKQYKKDIAGYLRKFSQNISQTTIDFIERMLHLDPSKRMSCEEALRHPFFSEQPLPCPRGEIQQQQYQYHEMFKDRSIRIERDLRKSNDYDKPKPMRDQHYQDQRIYPPIKYRRDERKVYYHRPEKKEDYESRNNYRYDYKHQEKRRKIHRSQASSVSIGSNSGTSSSQSSFSSVSERSGRSRNKTDRMRKEDRYSRDQKYERKPSYRDKEERKRYEARQDKRYTDKYQRRKEQRDDKYYKRDNEEKRYKSYHEEDPKRRSDERKRDYRDEKYPLRQEDKKYQPKEPRRESFDRREELKTDKRQGRRRLDIVEEKRIDKIEERRSEKRQEPRNPKIEEKRFDKREERREERKSQKRDERREDRRSQKRDYIGKEDYVGGSKERRYDVRYEKGSYEPKYYDQRDYKKRDEKYSRTEKDKYQDYQKHGEVVRRDQLDAKRGYGRRNSYKKDYGYSESSDDRSQHHHPKREKDYKHHKSSHYDRYQRKNYYKKQHQSSHDHRNH